MALADGARFCGSAKQADAKVIVATYQKLKSALGVTAAYEAGQTDDCIGAKKAAYPTDEYLVSLPSYFTPSYKVSATEPAVGARSGKCQLTAEPTDYSIFEKDSYRRCAYDNRPAALGG